MSEGLGVGFLRQMRPYFRQVAGLLVIGSLAGIAMNVAVVLPSVQAMWYVPQGLNIWEQLICEFPGHYARDCSNATKTN